MNILAFGMIAEITGKENLTINNISNTDELKAILFQQFPELSNLNFIISVNRKIVHGNVVLDDVAEVALLPPFSGG
jgi:molybdopterin converting factor small subunit